MVVFLALLTMMWVGTVTSPVSFLHAIKT